MACSFLLLFYSFWWLCDNLVPPLNDFFFSQFYKFNVSMISAIFHSLSKNWIVHYFEEAFFKITFFPLFFILHSHKCMVLTMLSDWILLLYVLFLLLIHGLIIALKVLCKTKFSLLYKLRTSLLSFFLVKIVNHCVNHTFLEYQHLLQVCILCHYFHHIFYKLFIKVKLIISPFKTIKRKFLQLCPSV